MKWTIAKQFDFCYGHRVWSQNLIENYSTDMCLACRHLHGHQGTIIISLTADKLEQGMVTDFKHLGWFKKWLDDTLDHKFIIDKNDPARESLFPFSSDEIGDVNNDNYNYHEDNYWTPKSGFIDSLEGFHKEIYEGLIITPFVPTSENLCEWLYSVVQKKMSKINITVSNIQFYETPKSQSNFSL